MPNSDEPCFATRGLTCACPAEVDLTVCWLRRASFRTPILSSCAWASITSQRCRTRLRAPAPFASRSLGCAAPCTPPMHTRKSCLESLLCKRAATRCSEGQWSDSFNTKVSASICHQGPWSAWHANKQLMNLPAVDLPIWQRACGACTGEGEVMHATFSNGLYDPWHWHSHAVGLRGDMKCLLGRRLCALSQLSWVQALTASKAKLALQYSRLRSGLGGCAGPRRQRCTVLVCDGTQGRRRQEGGVDDSATASRFQRWQPGCAMSSGPEGHRE